MSEDARPFEEYKEMIKDMRKEEMIKGLYDLSKNIIEKGKEIERINKSLEEQRHFYLDQLQQKEKIIKEVREYIEDLYDVRFTDKDKRKILEILDKAGSDKID